MRVGWISRLMGQFESVRREWCTWTVLCQCSWSVLKAVGQPYHVHCEARSIIDYTLIARADACSAGSVVITEYRLSRSLRWLSLGNGQRVFDKVCTAAKAVRMSWHTRKNHVRVAVKWTSSCTSVGVTVPSITGRIGVRGIRGFVLWWLGYVPMSCMVVVDCMMKSMYYFEYVCTLPFK